MPATPIIGTQISISRTLDIDLNQVPYKKVKAYIKANQLYTLADYAAIKSFDFNNTDLESFYHHRKSFIIKKDIDSVWNKYKSIHPSEAWKGDVVSFGFQYSKSKNKLTYLKDAYEGLEKGQLVFINVCFIFRLIHIAVGHEITEVNDDEKTLRTNYLNGGKAAGTQQIKLELTPEGYTKVTHHTIYKSDSKFRDKFLYPILHSKAIAAFHNNIKASLG